MLATSFFNLIKSESGKVVVRVDEAFGGIQLGFTDGKGDELEIVLSPETARKVVVLLDEVATKPVKSAPKKKTV